MVLSREQGRRIRKQGGGWSVGLLLLPFLLACSSPQPPEEFREAFAALDKALQKERLDASSFAPRFPDPTARQVASYILSQAGAEILQVSVAPLQEDVDPLSDVPVWPSSITLWHTTQQRYGKRRQVILTWKDADNILIASAYTAQESKPVYTREWKIVPLSPTTTLDTSDFREFQAF